MDTPSKNGSYVVIAACILAGISLILAIVSFNRVSSLKETIGGNGDLAERLNAVEEAANKASADAKKATARTSNLSRDIQQALDDVSTEMGALRTEVNRLTIKNGGSIKKASTTTTSSSTSSTSDKSDEPAATTSSSSGGTYTIVSGDTFARIAAQKGVSLQSLMDANPGVDPRLLRVGQRIIIP
jgi:hypothetical protein